ncbi:MAG: hypothetical protein Aurels2KO_41690 [Aureliella sp.]
MFIDLEVPFRKHGTCLDWAFNVRHAAELIDFIDNHPLPIETSFREWERGVIFGFPWWHNGARGRVFNKPNTGSDGGQL